MSASALAAGELHLGITAEVAAEVLAELRAPGAIRYDGKGKPEEQPAWWVGRLEGALAALLAAVESQELSTAG
jgi:hypothetical protein